jgi:hypothetical protein
MSGVLPRMVAACAAAVLAVAVAAGPAYAAGPAGRVPLPGHPARPAGGLVIKAIPASGGSFEITNFEFPKCIGISGAPPDGQAGDWDCTTNPDQLWHWGNAFPSDPDFRQLVNGRGQCLGVAGGSDQQGALIVGWTCLGTGHPDQYWAQEFRLNGTPGLMNEHGINDPSATAWLIGVQGASSANGANLVLWPDTGHPDQEWMFQGF